MKRRVERSVGPVGQTLPSKQGLSPNKVLANEAVIDLPLPESLSLAPGIDMDCSAPSRVRNLHDVACSSGRWMARWPQFGGGDLGSYRLILQG